MKENVQFVNQMLGCHSNKCVGSSIYRVKRNPFQSFPRRFTSIHSFNSIKCPIDYFIYVHCDSPPPPPSLSIARIHFEIKDPLQFCSNFKSTICRQTVQNLMRRHKMTDRLLESISMYSFNCIICTIEILYYKDAT